MEDQEKLIKQITEELTVSYIALKKSEGKNEAHDLFSSIIGQFVYNVVIATLLEKPSNSEEMTKEELYDHTFRNFKEIKNVLTETICASMSQVMLDFSGQDLEYVCTLVPIKDAGTKVIQ